MLETTREKILDNVKTELSNIKTVNGYDTDIAEVKIGLYGNGSVTNYPTAFLMYGDDNLVKQTEGLILGESQIDLAVIVYLNANTENLANETEKVIKDLYKFFSRDSSIASNYTSSLSNLEYVMNYTIQVTSSYITGINNATACGIVLKIDYYNKIDSTPLPEAEIPILNTPSNGYAEGNIKQAFEWFEANNAISYRIQIADDVNFENITLDQSYLNYTSYTIPTGINLVDGETYYWRVRSIGVNESSGWSDVWEFTVNDVVLPEAPILIAPLATTETTPNIDFVWDISERATNYDFQLSSDSGFNTLIVDTNILRTTFEYTFTNNGTYYWRVRGKNTYGVSSWVSNNVVYNIAYEAETLAYQTRVLADGGEIISLEAVNTTILNAKLNGYWNNVRSWVNPQFGIKKTGSNITKLYCLTGFDIIGTVTPNYDSTGLNNLPTVTFNGTSQYMTVPNVGLGLLSAEVFVVGQRDADPTTDPTSGFWYYGTQSGVDNHVPYADGVIYDGWGTTVRKTVGNPTPSLANKFLYNISTASGAWTARLNSSQIYTTSTNTVGFRTSPLLGKSEGAYYYKGKFSSILLLNTVATTAQRSSINTFLNSLYGIY